MLAEMARKILYSLEQLDELRDAWMVHMESGVAEHGIRRNRWIVPAPVRHDAGQAVEVTGLEPERLADITRSGAAAIRNHVCRHCRAALTVSLIEMLNDTLALITAGQVEIDVGPFAAFFGKKPFEQQVHVHWIDSRDAQRVTHCAVRRRPAALNENSLSPAK